MRASHFVWLVMRRELRETIRGRTFLVSSALLLLILGFSIGVPAVMDDPGKTAKIGLVGHPSSGLVKALEAAAKPFDARLDLHRYPDAAAARDAVAHRKIDAALLAGGKTLAVRADPPGQTVAIVGNAVAAVELNERVARLGITTAQAAALLAPAVALSEVQPASGTGEDTQLLGYVSGVLLFLVLSIYGQTVMMSVIQEKSSRIVEVLLTTLRPRHLLAGKVAGVGSLGLAQVAVVGVAAVAAGVTGLVDLPSAGRTAPLALLWFLLGFAFYAVAFAAVGALVSRVEDSSAAATPITMVMIACYLLSFVTALPHPDGLGAVVLSMVPPSAPFVLPARAALTSVPLWQHGVALLLMLATIWGLVRLGGKVYELGLLQTGPRIPLRNALRTVVGR